jgi:hypothetical protein
VQRWLGFRRCCDLDDQYLKQDIIRHVKDIEAQAKSKPQVWNRAIRKDHEENAREEDSMNIEPYLQDRCQTISVESLMGHADSRHRYPRAMDCYKRQMLF